MLCVNFTQIIGTLLGDHMAVRKSLSSGLALCFSVCTTPQKEIAIPQSTKEQVNFWDASFLRAQPASAAPHQAAPTQNLIITPIFQDTAEYDSNSHSTTSTSTSSFYHFCVINNLSEATINHIFMRLRSNSFTMVMITGSLAPLGQLVDLNSPMNALTSTNAVASTFNPACNRLTTGVGKTKSSADDIIKEQFSRNNMVIVVKQLNMIDIEQLAPYKDQVRFFLQQNRASWPIRQAIYSLINHKEQQAQMTAVAQLAPQQTPDPQTAPAAQVTQVAQVAQVAQVMAPIPQQTVQIQVQNPQPIPQQLQQLHPAPIAMTIAPQARSLPPHRQMQPLYPQQSTMRAPLNPMPQIQTQIQTQVPMQPAPTPQRVMQAPMQVTMQPQAQPQMQMQMQMQQQSPVLMPVQHGLQATTPQNIMQAPPAMSITPAAGREALHLAPVRAHAKVALEQQLNDSIFDLPSSEEVLNLKDIGDATVAAAATAHANEDEQSVLEEFTTMMRHSVRASKRAPEISISTPISSANWNSCNQTDEIEDDGDTEHPRQMAQKQRQKQDQAQEATNSNKPCYHSGVSARGHGDIRCLNGVSEFQRWPAITISSCLASSDHQHQDESGRRSKPSSYSNHDYCGLFGCDTGSYTDFGCSACNQRQAPYLYLCCGCSASDNMAQANAAEKRLAEEAIQWPQLDHQSVLQTKAAICWSDSTVLPSSLLWRGSSASGWLLSHSSYSIHLTKEAPHASPLPLLQVQSVAHRAALAPARAQVQTYMKKQTTATAVTSLELPNSQVIHLQSLTPLPPLHMSTEELLARQKEILQGLQEPLKPLASSTQHGRNKSRS